ncbi:MAG: hypothetical protein ACU0B7_07320 [Paracoccaceae bacterium]
MAIPDDIDELGDTPRPLVVRVKLTSVQDVQKELSKLYRLARAKKLDTSEASKLANILMLIARIMETSDLEERIDRLEVQG